MKKTILSLFATISLTFFASAQQVSLFDSEGEAIAYIDYTEDATIFMWSGTPVAFIKKDRRDLCVFGFNGSFLGWYEDGVVYDKKRYVVGVRKGAVSLFTRIERIKSIQRITPIRPITQITPIQPIVKSSWSNTSLTEFLYYGEK